MDDATPSDDDGYADAVDDLDREFEAAPGELPGPLDWRAVTSAEGTDRWRALDSWVRWLVLRYALDPRELPPCWWCHEALVEELSALHGYHQVAFDQSQPATVAAEWHRVFWEARVRLRDWASRTGCTGREHRPSDIPDWAAPTPAYAEQFSKHVRADAAVRKHREMRAALSGDPQ